ncbi:MAG TPA: response regulator [Actinomycetes bacterium]|nr:response regulator [Actinomycetes bacterium]
MPTVLIADDSPTLRRIVSTVLERAGYTVVLATDGVEAIQGAFRVQPDAIILDVQMPRLSGYVTARLLKDDWQTAEIPVLLLTSLDAASDRYWGAQTGADRFLTKDFEAPQLVAAVQEVVAAADEARGGRPPLRPDPVELADDEVLARVSELLDRKLFEASVSSEVTQIAADVHGFEETVAAVLSVLGRIVDYDLAAVCMLDDRLTYLTVARECPKAQYGEFLGAIADAATQVTGTPIMVHDLVPRVADPRGLLGQEDEGRMATFLSMPLRAGGRVVGCLALSSGTKNAFGEASLNTLRLVEGPAAVVISNARHDGRVQQHA